MPVSDDISLVLDPGNPFGTYADGYWALASMAVAHKPEESPDILVFPVLFCLRHYLELRLKELIEIAGDLLDKNLTAPMNHNLLKLWLAVRALLERIWQHSDADFDAIEAVIRELDEADPHPGTAFRFPFDQNREESLQGIDYINIRRAYDVVDRIRPTLDGAAIGIYEFLDNKHDPNQ